MVDASVRAARLDVLLDIGQTQQKKTQRIALECFIS